MVKRFVHLPLLLLRSTYSSNYKIKICINLYFLELIKGDKDKDKKRAATQAAFKRKFKKNSDFWMYEKKVRFVIRKMVKQQWFYW